MRAFTSSIEERLSIIKNSPEQVFFGINDTYSDGGEYNFLKEKFNLTADAIAKKITKKFNN